MKKTTTLFLTLCIYVIAFSQAVITGRLENLKDAWDLTYNYTGEIKNGKPNGMGVASYTSGNVLRYTGNFVNGVYSGKGTMLFNDGAFLAGDWKNGKLNGKGTNYSSDGSLYIGEFVNGEKNGRGVLVFKNNSFRTGTYKNDKMDGRNIEVWPDGGIISDCFYSMDQRNGGGYQYEAKDKKLYEGTWRDDKWVSGGNAGFSTFLKGSRFISEQTSSHILVGPVSNRLLTDTAYYYDLDQKKRYFGYYENGQLRNGLIIRDDSTRFWGPLNDKGASGYAYDFKFNSYFSEGNYTNDYLNGKILDIDIPGKKVYYGDALNGSYTGKAWFVNDKGTIYSGDYLKGKFTGQGKKILTNGYTITGTWEEGACLNATQITNPKGVAISLKPKTLTDAIVLLANLDIANLDLLEGENVSNSDYGFADYHHKSLMSFPGSLNKDAVIFDFEEYPVYLSPYLEKVSFEKAKAKYNELCNQVRSMKFVLKPGSKAEQLTGDITKAEEGAMHYSSFKPVNDSKFPSGFSVNVFIYKMSDDDEYGVALSVCDENSEAFTVDDEVGWYVF